MGFRRQDKESSLCGAISDRIVLAVVQGRRAEGEGPLIGQAVERPEHGVRHVIGEHPGADQNTPECHFVGPLRPVPGLGKTGSEERGRERIKKKTLVESSPHLKTYIVVIK